MQQATLATMGSRYFLRYTPYSWFIQRYNLRIFMKAIHRHRILILDTSLSRIKLPLTGNTPYSIYVTQKV